MEVVMTRRVHLVAAILCSLVIVGTWLSAQAIAPKRIDPPVTISGADIAFRVEARRGDTVEGRLLVRMDGEWVEADVDGGLRVRRLQTK
jgi:hypothetical protein